MQSYLSAKHRESSLTDPENRNKAAELQHHNPHLFSPGCEVNDLLQSLHDNK